MILKSLLLVSAPPAPPTSATPTLAAQDSQRFEAMLQSIHQGQILLLQNLQVVSPPGSILSVEQFIKKESWPGTLPSTVREGEGPSAQVPQQVQDASSEATIPGAFDFLGGRVNMRPEEAIFPEPVVPVIHEIVEASGSQLRQEATTPKRTP